jgi:hypothetical protein
MDLQLRRFPKDELLEVITNPRKPTLQSLSALGRLSVFDGSAGKRMFQTIIHRIIRVAFTF